MAVETLQLIILNVFCLLLISNSALYYTYFWQLKEYRLDRMVDFLRTATGKRRLLNWLLIAKLFLLTVLILVYATFYLSSMVSGEAKGTFLTGVWANFLPVVGVLAAAEIVEILVRFFKRRLYRPEWTTKALIIVFLTIILAAFWPVACWINLTFSIRTVAIKWSVIYILAPLLNALIILLFYPLTQLGKRIILARAHKKMAQFPHLKVIAITGSYGKSSTKEFLSQLLSTKYQVLKTPGNTNTEIGVARIILNNLTDKHDVFIVEAGAYKIGEIRKIAEMVHPEIAIVTAVKDSHLSLFGSLENIKRGKFELIEGMKNEGIAIFNYDNDGARDLAKRAAKLKIGKVVGYSMQGRGQLEAKDVLEGLDGVTFSVNSVPFSLSVPGRHNVVNFLGAVCAAQELGVSLEEMAKIAVDARLREHTLSVIKAGEGLVLLDDTYNANPDGVIAALNYLDLYKDWQKIIVFPGMLELGERSEAEHRRVIKRITQVCDHAVFISLDFYNEIEKAAIKNHFNNFRFIISNPVKLLHYLRAKIRTSKRKTVILFISRGSEKVLKSLKHAS